MSDTTYPWTSLLLWCLTNVWELPDSRTSSTKRQVTPFLYIGLHLRQLRPQARLQHEDDANLHIISETQSKKTKKDATKREIYCDAMEKKLEGVLNISLTRPRKSDSYSEFFEKGWHADTTPVNKGRAAFQRVTHADTRVTHCTFLKSDRLSVNKSHFSENKWHLFKNKRALS